MLTVRPLLDHDVESSTQIHLEVLHMEFLARCGRRFIGHYHRAWLASPHGLALACVDGDGRLLGVVLAALDPPMHFRSMVRHHGLRLAFSLLGHAVANPAFAKTLIATRAVRYSRGLARMLVAQLHPGQRAATATDAQARVGEVTHVMVSAQAQGRGVGRALLAEVRRQAARAGLSELVLVTPPGLDAAGFYEHMGWKRDGQVTSRSGETFLAYRLPLDDPGGGVTEEV
ncbi:MAG TPA: GNAT family N-acetyltransferase [Acidimicrobiales bacterium]|nr:GNAT family N-acetyltransferase [Acidimicrobiales bacterium]